VRIKPGKPFVFGVKGRGSGFGVRGSGEEGVPGFDPKPETRDPKPDVFVFGLPGNPVSAFVCTVRLASRLIGRLCGEARATEPWAPATIAEALPANGPREFYQPVFCRNGVAEVLKWKGSADVFTLAAANALLVREENAPPLPAGAAVRVLEV
jgi:molybdopterin molybdotransferase